MSISNKNFAKKPLLPGVVLAVAVVDLAVVVVVVVVVLAEKI